MRSASRAVLVAVGVILTTALGTVTGAETPLRIGVFGEAPEFLRGVTLAVDAARLADAKRAVETVPLSSKDSAPAVVDAALKAKCCGIVAAGSTASLEAPARKAKVPLVLAGSSAPGRTVDPADPVFRVEPSEADYAAALLELLRFRSGRSTLGLPAETKRAWLVVANSPWAHAVAAAIRSDDVDGLVAPGDTDFVQVDAAAIAKAREAGCDRVVVVADRGAERLVVSALRQAKWDVPTVATDFALDGSAFLDSAGASWKCAFVAAIPAWAADRHIDELFGKSRQAEAPAQLSPLAVRGFVAAAALLEAAAHTAKGSLVPALREIREGSGPREARLFDASGCVDRWRWSTWVAGEDAVAVPVKTAYLPDPSGGLLLGPGLTRRYRVAEGQTCVTVGFGGGAGQPARTVEADLATLGLGDGTGRPGELVREQVLARTLGKLARVWGRSRDGTARPALSFKIAFVAEGSSTKGASAVWDAVIAGDCPEAKHGGESFPGKGHCTAFSAYILRKNAELQKSGRLAPPLSDADLPYLEGAYAWNASAEGNQRADRIRALLEGVASTYCMKLCKEIGHLAGLEIDNSGNPLSVMVTRGGEGVADEFAIFPPADTKILERTLGRVADR